MEVSVKGLYGFSALRLLRLSDLSYGVIVKSLSVLLNAFDLAWHLYIEYLVFYAAFNIVQVISRRYLGKLPVLLVHLSWH